MSTYRKFEEYKMLVEDTAKQIDRRKNESNLFTTINSIFLTAIAILLKDSGLDNWAIAAGAMVIVIAGITISKTWEDMIDNYRKLSKLRYQVLWEMEENDLPDSVKIYHREQVLYPRDEEGKQVVTKGVFADTEKRLPRIFMLLYIISFLIIILEFIIG